MNSEEKKVIDWERIEVDFRAGVMSLREIADRYGITHGAINKRAKRDGWERDLNAKIKAKAAILVSKQAVSSEVSTKTLVTEKEVVEANATAIANVIRGHRAGIGKLQAMCDSMTEELTAQGMSSEDMRNLAEILAIQSTQEGEEVDEKDVNRRLASFIKLLGLDSRADTFKKLVEAKKNLVTLERLVFGLGEGTGEDPANNKNLTDEQVSAKLNALINKARSAT